MVDVILNTLAFVVPAMMIAWMVSYGMLACMDPGAARADKTPEA